MRRPLSSRNPVFYFVIVKLRRFARRIKWWFGTQTFAKTISQTSLAHSVYKHNLALIRDRDRGVAHQHNNNKIENLKIAIGKLDSIIIRPGETFSFCYLVGNATRRKGYGEARVFSNGEVITGIGGGLCKLTVLIHWLCLHSPLTVTEYHSHSFEPFPDDEGAVPSGYGPTLFYNYLDYQCLNSTDYIFQFRFWIENECLHGDLRVDTALPYRYHVFEKNNRFSKVDEQFYRCKEIWRQKYCITGELLETQLVQKNNVRVKYVPDEREGSHGVLIRNPYAHSRNKYVRACFGCGASPGIQGKRLHRRYRYRPFCLRLSKIFSNVLEGKHKASCLSPEVFSNYLESKNEASRIRL